MTTIAFPQAHALLVAIADYEEASALPSAVISDAEDVSKLLCSPTQCGYDPSKVRTLLNSHATRDSILTELDRLAHEVRPDDTLCIFFSGHGWRRKGSDESALLPVDARRAGTEQSAISATLLSEKLHAIRAARLMVFLDACHAGGAGVIKSGFPEELQSVGFSSKSIELLSSGSGRAIIASSRTDETSLILPHARNSAFTTALLEGLKGAADLHHEGSIRIFSLFDYISKRVPVLTNDRQHPILNTKLERNFAIALSPASELTTKSDLSSNPTLRDALQTILPPLYPAGPIDRDIWERAGGDLSCLNLGKPGRSMWFEALKLLTNGGGGDINFRNLIAEALNDYPRNEGLLALS